MRTLLFFSKSPPRLFAGKFHNHRQICNWHVVANLRANSIITEKYAIDMFDDFYLLFPMVDKTFGLFFPKEAYKWRTYWWAVALSFSVPRPTSSILVGCVYTVHSYSYAPLTF
jgi:hypothetical protein